MTENQRASVDAPRTSISSDLQACLRRSLPAVRRLTLFTLATLAMAHSAAHAQTHAQPRGDALDPSRLSVADLQKEMAQGRRTSGELVTYFLSRIDAIDRHGPRLNSVIEINPDALEIAHRLDEERRAGRVRGPLHGIPVLIKDNIDTADEMLTTAGSLALAETRPPRDAFIVTRLREAGAVILGKTNLSEWANFRSSRSTSGWSGRGGQTRNAHAPERNPCGSSSGSGTAMAAGLASIAVGTETDGSIVCPSSVNGIVGIKPTIGLVSRSGIIPIAASQDTAGPMARSVTDAAMLLTVLAGSDRRDEATAAARGRTKDYADALKADGLRGARIGVARSLAGFHPAVDALFAQAIDRLRAAGAIIVDPADIELPKTLDDDELTILLYEFKDGLNRYLADRPSGPRTLAELIAFNEREHEREMPIFGQELFLQAQSKGPLTDAEYREAHARAGEAARRGIDSALRQHRLDAIIAPTTGPAWLIDPVLGDQGVAGGASQPAAIAGYPHITVPMGEVQRLPVGLSFIGTAWSEATLIRLAFGFEQSAASRAGGATHE